MFEDREDYLLSTVTRQLQATHQGNERVRRVNAVQDHVLRAAIAHIDRIILEAFAPAT